MATDPLSHLPPQDRARYTVFHNAVVTCTRLYNEEPTAARLRDLRAAEEAFAAIRAELLGDGPVQGADQAPPFTATAQVPEVLAWLQAAGYRISRSQLYAHVSQGKLGRNADGQFTVRLVTRYARQFLKRAATGRTEVREQTDLAEVKLRAEIELKQAQAERERFRLEVQQGQWVRRDEVESEQVGRAALLDAGWDHVFHSRAGELVALLRQPGSGVPEAIAWLTQFKEDLLARYAAPFEFEVLGLDDDDQEDDHE